MFFRKEPSKPFQQFEKHEKVIISSDINEIKEKQKKCGGFSETNMSDILGSIGEVVCNKRQCVTVEVKGRQFDLHPDLLKRSRFSSLPSPDKEPFDYKIPIQSLPDPDIDNDSFQMPEVPHDTENGSSIENFSSNIYDDYKSRLLPYGHSDSASLLDPPRDEEDIKLIHFDVSEIKNFSPMETIEVQSIALSSDVPNKTIPLPSQSPETIPLPSQSPESIAIPSQNVNQTNSEYSAPKQILCQKCKDGTINYASSCGHCYCSNCKEGLDVCVNCKRVCGNWIKIHLQA